jgi:hypothetical protein
MHLADVWNDVCSPNSLVFLVGIWLRDTRLPLKCCQILIVMMTRERFDMIAWFADEG